jgi:heterodisulfide reductase subunit A
MERIAVFICECGPNIKDAIDIEALARFAGRLAAVVHVQAVGMLCTPDERANVSETIRRHRISHAVFAGCSPREHEKTFRGIMEAAGRNAFMHQPVNLREQCAWVVHDREQATGKAKKLLQGAVHRVRHHQPIITREIACRTDVLVIGAGVAGIGAARTLSQHSRRVYLVERSPCIGGMAALYEDLYPDFNCAACLLEPYIDDVLHDDRVTVMTSSEVLAVRGIQGNFTITLRQAARRVDPDRCVGCADCIDVCPVHVPNAFNARMDTRKAIFFPYPGCLPHVASIDARRCLHYTEEACRACEAACPFDAIDYAAEDTIREVAVGAVVLATGFHEFDATRNSRYGYRTVDNVITAVAFERLVNTTGPTGGRIAMASSQVPDSIAFVHCVGSRTATFNQYCSGVCCMSAFKHAQQAHKQLPKAAIHHFFADLCLPGKAGQRFFETVASLNAVSLHRVARPDSIQISAQGDRIAIRYTDISRENRRVDVQMVVLETAMEPAADAQKIARMLDIDRDEDGFFKAAHPVTDPVAATREGIYLAGCSQGPKDIASSMTTGQAAAGKILQKLQPGVKIALEPIVALVEPALCSACGTCQPLCPFGALDMNENDACLTVEDSLCRGCGICAAACPCGAIELCHYSREALSAEIAGLLGSGGD